MSRHIPSIVNMAQQTIRRQYEPGFSRHEARLAGLVRGDKLGNRDNTVPDYEKICVRFVKWAQAEHGCRTLEDARPHVQEYIDRYKNPFTANTYRSAICRLYHTDAIEAGWKTPSTKGEEITRGRDPNTERSKHWNPEKHPEFVRLENATGLRRFEIQKLYPNDPAKSKGREYIAHELTEKPILNPITGEKENRLHITNVRGKGGYIRDVLVLRGNEDFVRDLWERTPPGHLPVRVPQAANIHDMRAKYVAELYREYARDPRTLPRSEVYHPRGEFGARCPEGLDKKALSIVTESLGHHRLSVVVGNYNQYL